MPKSNLDLLLVEDNPADADFITEILEEATKKGRYADFQISIVWVQNLAEAVEAVGKNSFDLILLDLSLPDSFGIDTVKTLINTSFVTPIIVLTGDIDSTLWIDAIHEGAQDYLTKNNIDTEVLLRTIGHAIERSKLRLQLETTIEQLELYSSKLKQSNKELETFAYVASHDLQEPLRTIVAFTEKIESRSSSQLDDSAKDYFARIKRSTMRMQSLLDDLLDYSRVSFQKLNFQRIDLKKVFNQTILDLEKTISDTGASIYVSAEEVNKFTLSENGVINTKFSEQAVFDFCVTADETQMRRLFQNLITNAIKFRKKDAKPILHISLVKNKQERIISIQDNGIGFEEEYKDKIFQQFQRLHDRSEYEGTGMGLAIVKKIVETNSGKIDVTSKLGEGSCFVVRLKLDG
jgi:two-component system sensor histidine kinase/response regulator